MKERKDIGESQQNGIGQTRPTNGTAELRKQRDAPIWTGYRYEEWTTEIERWNENLRNVSDEEKYMQLLESLKKNSDIKDFVNNTLIGRFRDRRTVAGILEVMSEKYGRNTGEKCQS